jgi:DNA-binding NarL/FixJ family response regulator
LRPTQEGGGAENLQPPTEFMHNPADANNVLPIKVAIIEDRREIRDGLATLIQFTGRYTCVGQFCSMEEAFQQIGAHPPDVVLVDIGLPGMSGIEGIEILKDRYPQLLILVLTVYDDDERIFRAMCAGACGYLLKKTPPARLLDCIREAADGAALMSPEVARRVVTLFRKLAPPKGVDYHLTAHEIRLLQLLVEGHNLKAAAEKLGVSLNIIAFHMRQIYEKLQRHSQSEAVAKALRQGFV